MSKENSKAYLDKIGMCTSAICMIHCLIVPFLLIFGFDSVLKFVDQEWIEWTIILFALFVGAISFIGGFRSHKQHFIPVLFVAGFLLLINGESVSTTWLSTSLSIAGALVIAYAHILNLRWRQHAYTN